ncbi:hypothetical protein [Mesorhizobium sp. B2-7-1]|uniref:hypothetical protein n=1 Tax=Mesorhizobium sp. B2-7-1 TaxID=2589909 RepID=UPI0032B2A996
MGLGTDGQTTGSTTNIPATGVTASAAAPAARSVPSAGWANEGWSIGGTTGSERKRSGNSRAPLAIAALACLCLPAQAAIIGTCTVIIGASGTMKLNPSINIFGSKQADGSSAGATITANSTLCSILNLLDCYTVSAPAPVAFTSAPSGGDTNVTFASVFRLDGSGLDVSGSSPQKLNNGTHTMQVDLTATKSPGIFPAGNYQAQVTVRCE